MDWYSYRYYLIRIHNYLKIRYENKNSKGVEKKVDDIIKEVVSTLSEDKRLELINKMSEYLHINASMMTWDERPEYILSK